MPDEIKNHWVVHPLRPGCPISLRALNPKGSSKNLYPRNITYHPDDYGSEDALKAAFEADALRLSSEGYAVYTVLNQIRPDFREHRAVRDADITHRLSLLIDIDRTSGTDQPANEEEILAAENLANMVESALADRGVEGLFRVHSGNGFHLYVPIESTEISGETTSTVERFLRLLSENFKTDVVGIDTSVYNPSRITKVLGTLARKGTESPDRPYRTARLA